MSGAWSLRGELVLSCSCTVFCPCTLSLGLAPPTEGYCQTWAGIRIDEGRFDETDLAGVKVGLIIEIPGLMSRGNWTAAMFVDDKASIHAVKALTRIFTTASVRFASYNVIFPAHGVSPLVKSRARERGLHCIDATCPDVTVTHDLVQRLVAQGYYVLYVGKKGHPEPEGG